MLKFGLLIFPFLIAAYVIITSTTNATIKKLLFNHSILTSLLLSR